MAGFDSTLEVLAVEVRLDDEKFQKQLTTLRREVKQAASELRRDFTQLGASATKVSGGLTNVARAAKRTSTATDGLGRSTKRVKDSMSTLSPVAQRLIREVKSLKNDYDLGATSGRNLVRTGKQLRDQLRQQALAAGRGSDEYDKLAASARKLNTQMNRFDARGRRLALSTRLLGGNIQSLRVAFGALRGAIVIAAVALTTQLTRAINQTVAVSFEAEVRMRLFSREVKNLGQASSVGEQSLRRLADEFRTTDDVIAAGGVQLVRYGATVEQTEQLLRAGAASALAFGRTASAGFEAVAQAVVGEQSVILNRIGIAGNLSTAYRRYADDIGKTTDALSKQEKLQAAINLILGETQGEIEALPDLLGGYGGAVTRLSANWREFRIELGERARPGATRFFNVLADGLQTLTRFSERLRGESTLALQEFDDAIGTADDESTVLGALDKLAEATGIDATNAFERLREEVQEASGDLEEFTRRAVLAGEAGTLLVEQQQAVQQELQAQTNPFANVAPGVGFADLQARLAQLGFAGIAQDLNLDAGGNLVVPESLAQTGLRGENAGEAAQLIASFVRTTQDFQAGLRASSEELGRINSELGELLFEINNPEQGTSDDDDDDDGDGGGGATPETFAQALRQVGLRGTGAQRAALVRGTAEAFAQQLETRIGLLGGLIDRAVLPADAGGFGLDPNDPRVLLLRDRLKSVTTELDRFASAFETAREQALAGPSGNTVTTAEQAREATRQNVALTPFRRALPGVTLGGRGLNAAAQTQVDNFINFPDELDRLEVEAAVIASQRVRDVATAVRGQVERTQGGGLNTAAQNDISNFIDFGEELERVQVLAAVRASQSVRDVAVTLRARVSATEAPGLNAAAEAQVSNLIDFDDQLRLAEVRAAAAVGERTRNIIDWFGEQTDVLANGRPVNATAQAEADGLVRDFQAFRDNVDAAIQAELNAVGEQVDALIRQFRFENRRVTQLGRIASDPNLTQQLSVGQGGPPVDITRNASGGFDITISVDTDSDDVSEELRQAGIQFASQVADAGLQFASAIKGFAEGDIGSGISGLGSVATGLGGAISGLVSTGVITAGSALAAAAPPLAIAGIALSVLGGLFSLFSSDSGDSPATDSAQSRRNLSQLELNFTFNQTNSLGLLDDPNTTRKLGEASEDAFRRFEDIIKRNINPRLDALEARI